MNFLVKQTSSKLIPVNKYFNLQVVNQLLHMGGIAPRRGRPTAIVDAVNKLVEKTDMANTIQQALPAQFRPLNIFWIDGIIGTSRYKITPTNAWRRFFGFDIRKGRPTHGERVLSQALRMAGAPDPKTAAFTYSFWLVGLAITFCFHRWSKPPEPTQPAPPKPDVPDVDDDDLGGEVMSLGSLALTEASLFVLVRCKHDDCDDHEYVEKSELDEYVYKNNQGQLVWVCCKTKAYQPCEVIDLNPTEVFIHVHMV